jgi:hypothetical protein
MPWWGWLLAAWIAVATVAAVWLAAALHLAEIRDWIRRGAWEQRRNPRPDRQDDAA